MPDELRIVGVEKLDRLAKQLNDDKSVKRDMTKALNRAAEPLKVAVREGAVEKLPKRGGLNQWVAGSKFTVKTRTSGRNPSVRLAAAKTKSKGKTDLEALDRGRLRHPVYGNRKVWVLQNVTPGWFTKSADEDIGPVQAEMLTVFDEIERRISG